MTVITKFLGMDSYPGGMSSSIAVLAAQYAPTMEYAHNVTGLETAAERAAAVGAQFVVCPEYASGFRPELGPWMAEVAQPADGEFAQRVGETAAKHGLTIVIGMLEANDSAEDSRPYNTTIAFSSAGLPVAKYRKVHLYDAFGASESTWVAPGSPNQPPAVFDLGSLRVGLQTCYDLRFPEVSRRLVDAGATVLAIPAEWVAGPMKAAHWDTLLRARAIENTAFVVAADHPAPIGVGQSQIIDPAGTVLAAVGSEAGDAVAWLAPHQLEAARERNPALRARRYRVEPGTPRAGTE